MLLLLLPVGGGASGGGGDRPGADGHALADKAQGLPVVIGAGVVVVVVGVVVGVVVALAAVEAVDFLVAELVVLAEPPVLSKVLLCCVVDFEKIKTGGGDGDDGGGSAGVFRIMDVDRDGRGKVCSIGTADEGKRQ